MRLAAAREAWFGAALRGHFVESFATARGDVWLVFEHAGRSLHDHLFEADPTIGVLRPTRAWRQLRLDADGPRKFAELCVGLLEATASVHMKGVVHRDVAGGAEITPSTRSRRWRMGGAIDAPPRAGQALECSY